MLVSPAYRGALVVGKAASAGVRGLVETVIIYAVTLLLGIHVRLAPLPMFGVLCAVLLGSAAFSTFSPVIACIVKTRDRFMGIGQVITMPQFFASNAIYPVEMMRPWLQVVARARTLSVISINALRTLMVQGGRSAFGLELDFGVQLLAFVVLVAIAARLYPAVTR